MIFETHTTFNFNSKVKYAPPVNVSDQKMTVKYGNEEENDKTKRTNKE